MSSSSVRAYLGATAFVFGLITATHVWRMVVERELATAPWFLALTGLSAVLCLWSCWLLWRKRGAEG